MGAARFVGQALIAAATFVPTPALSQGEPPLPASFRWKMSDLPVLEVLDTKRSTKTDRGDDYLAKFWYEFKTSDERVAGVSPACISSLAANGYPHRTATKRRHTARRRGCVR